MLVSHHMNASLLRFSFVSSQAVIGNQLRIDKLTLIEGLDDLDQINPLVLIEQSLLSRIDRDK